MSGGSKVSGKSMGEFWDDRAREDPFYFVDNSGRYQQADVDRFWAVGEAQLDELLQAVGASVQPPDTVLDLGCGVGRLTRVLARRAEHVHALDVSTEMLGKARELNTELDNVTWHHNDGTTLQPVADGSIDAVVSHVVFQHIPDPAITLGYIREIGRVLKPGGWGAFQISNDPGLHEPRYKPPPRWKVVLGMAPKGQRNPRWLGTHVELDDVRDAARDGGTEVEAVHGEGTQFCYVKVARR
jgi:SAM-dependent methyltransferase